MVMRNFPAKDFEKILEILLMYIFNFDTYFLKILIC